MSGGSVMKLLNGIASRVISMVVPAGVACAQAGALAFLAGMFSISRAQGTSPVWSTGAHGQSQSPSGQPFSLRSGVTIRLSRDWGQDPYDRILTPPALDRYAPHDIGFSEFPTMQNLKEHALLKLANINNPLQGRDQRDLNAQIHEPPSSGRGMLNYLSYFFFPPPLHCVEQAFADYGRAISQSKPDENADVSIAANCQYLPTLPDFYSAQLSHGLVFRRVSGLESVDSTWGKFYLPSVEQVETNGLTFFVYEAQGLEQLTLETTRQFNLPEDLQGAQVDFFWAIGAPSPFPFMVDPTHTNAPLIHVVYAGVDLGANQRPVFMKLLEKVTVPLSFRAQGSVEIERQARRD